MTFFSPFRGPISALLTACQELTGLKQPLLELKPELPV